MEFNPLPTQNWSRAFNIWIEDIQVQFQPVIELERALIHGGLLRRVRSFTRFLAVLVMLLFTLHCTRARVVTGALRPAPIQGGESGLAGYSELGEASWYGSDEDGFAGKPTANGDIFDPERLTCAHRTLPLGSYVEVENLENGKKAVFLVNDRGPFIRGRILDVSRQGARDLGFIAKGVARIEVRAINVDGSPASVAVSQEKVEPYTVQVAALTDPSNIERLQRALEESFSDVSLQEVHTRQGREVKRIWVGSFVRFEDAQKAAEEIAKRFGGRGVEPFITRRR